MLSSSLRSYNISLALFRMVYASVLGNVNTLPEYELTLQNGLSEESDSKFDLHVLNGRFRSRMVWLRGQVNKRLKSTRQQSRTSRTSRLGWLESGQISSRSSGRAPSRHLKTWFD